MGSPNSLRNRNCRDSTSTGVALRLASVVGPGVRGNMASLIWLARTLFPLPLGALRAQRSLLSLDNLVGALLAVSTTRQRLQRPLIVADPDPLNIPQMITAMRAGLGRQPGLIHVPTSLLARGFQFAGRSELYRRLAEPLVANPSSSIAARLGSACRDVRCTRCRRRSGRAPGP